MYILNTYQRFYCKVQIKMKTERKLLILLIAFTSKNIVADVCFTEDFESGIEFENDKTFCDEFTSDWNIISYKNINVLSPNKYSTKFLIASKPPPTCSTISDIISITTYGTVEVRVFFVPVTMYSNEILLTIVEERESSVKFLGGNLLNSLVNNFQPGWQKILIPVIENSDKARVSISNYFTIFS